MSIDRNSIAEDREAELLVLLIDCLRIEDGDNCNDSQVLPSPSPQRGALMTEKRPLPAKDQSDLRKKTEILCRAQGESV